MANNTTLADLDVMPEAPDPNKPAETSQPAESTIDPNAAPSTNPVPDNPPAEEPADETPEEGEEEPGSDEDPLSFWKDVDNLRGEPVEADYGATVPNSPEWVLIREKAIEEKAVLRFEQTLEERDPRGYRYLLHRSKGGTDEEFFNIKVPTLPDYETFKNSVDLQAELLRRDLLNKEVDPDVAQAVIDAAIKKDELFKKADAVYRNTQTGMQEALDKQKQELEQAEKALQHRVAEVNNSIASTIKSPSLAIVIPETEQAGFTKFVSGMLAEDNGEFLLLQPIKKENMNELMSAMYLLYKKGDLSGLITRKAKSLFTARTRATVDAATNKRTTESPQAKFSAPLKDL